MSYTILTEDLSEDIDTAYAQDSWKLSSKDLVDSQHHPIHVCYQYLDLGVTKYGFNQEFLSKDANMYFKIMRCFAESTINQLINDGGRGTKIDNQGNFVKLRRHDSLHKALRDELSKISNDMVQNRPMIFHFGLYTDPDSNASRETGIRSPRIYFMLGIYGLIYPLFFDPFHELTS